MNSSDHRIALFLPNLKGGGAQRIMVNLAGGFVKRGIQVDLVVVRAEGAYLSRVPAEVRLINLHAPRALAALLPLERYLRRERPHMLLSALDYANVLAIWARYLARVKTKVAVCTHTTLSLGIQQEPPVKRKFLPALMRSSYRRADVVICVSEGSADDLSRMINLDRSRIHVIYNPVITPETERAAREPLDHSWFSPGEPPVVLSVGRLEVQKSHHIIIQAFAQIRRKRRVRLVILGEGSLREKHLALAHSLGVGDDVQMPGFVNNPYAYMSRAAVLAQASAWEALPTAIIEALACGTPVVATDCPHGPREILKDGRYGHLVSVGDVGSFARALELVLDGGGIHPPQESYAAYRLDTVTEQYMRILLQDNGRCNV